MRIVRSLVLGGCIGASPWALALPPAEVFAKASPAVAVLEVLDDKGQRLGSASATVVGGERLVTTCDGLEGAASLRVVARSGSFPASVAARDRERNLCFLAAPGLKEAPLPAETRALPPGSRVLAISNALGLGVGISEGVVSGIRDFPMGSFIQFTAPISPGSEGGALVDEAGRLVGILDYRRRDGQNVNFAAPAGWLRDVEARARAGEARLQRYDHAMALLREQKWGDLKALASAWAKEEADSQDAWRFVVAAAKGMGDGEGELHGWQELRRLDPASAVAGIGLGRALLARGKKEEALDLARQLTARQGEDAAAWHFLGQARQAAGQLAEADQAYRRAVELDPWLVAGYQSLAALAQARGDARMAIAIWRRLSGLYGDAAWPRLGLAMAYLTAGDPQRAWFVLSMLSGAEADSALAWYWKGVTLARLGCPEQAIDAYRKSLEKQPEQPEWAWGGIGYARAEQRAYREAIEAFRAAAKANPGNDEWRYQAAVNLKDSGRPGEALAITTDLVAKHPEEARNWRQHGFALAVLGRPEEAIPALERTLQMEPKQAKVWAALVEVYQQAGRRQEARRTYETLRGIDAEMAKAAYRDAILPYEEEAR